MAYDMAKQNEGVPGSDGVTFAAIEEQGGEPFLEQIQDELIRRTYVPCQREPLSRARAYGTSRDTAGPKRV